MFVSNTDGSYRRKRVESMTQQKKRENPALDALKRSLKEQGIHLSHQRLKVLEYLLSHEGHPSADQIYRELRDQMATLSKATVYNTLNLFAEAGIIRAVNIEGYEVRYDSIMQPHGHFKCQRCGRIYDFEIDSDALAFQGLGRFQIRQKDVYFKGVCAECLSNQKQSKEE